VSQVLPARVLIVDDDPYFVRRVRVALDGMVEMQIVSSEVAALAAIEAWHPDVVVIDVMTGDAGAFRLLDEIRDRSRGDGPRVLYLAKGPGSVVRLQGGNGSFLGVIRRECSVDGLMYAVRSALATVVTGSLLVA
jgi:CheY-like chemotaxis protein